MTLLSSAPPGPPPSAQRRRVIGLCLALAALTLAVFGRTLGHSFINFDDGDYVVRNPMVNRGLTFRGFLWAFAGAHCANWHPLTWLSHMLDCTLYGLNPGGHHLSSVLLHTATVIVLFLLLLRMTGAVWRCAFVAAVFAIHPLRAESVAWVAERKDVLSGLFFMLTLLAYANYVGSLKSAGPREAKGQGPKSAAESFDPMLPAPRFTLPASRWYAVCLLCFALGLMSKPMLVTLPVVLLLLDYWPLRRWERLKSQVSSLKSRAGGPSSLLLEKLPFVVLSTVSCLVTLSAQHQAIKSFDAFPLVARIGAAVLSCNTYLAQMVYPAGLAAYYPFPLHASVWNEVLAGLLLAAVSVTAWAERRARPWLLVGWLWYLIMLLPVLGLVQVGGQAHADRYTYLPQIGVYVALTWLAGECAAKWRASRVVVGGLMALVVAVLMACAWRQTGYWKNSEALWRHALQCTAGNTLAYVNLGHELFEQRRFDEVIAHYQRGLEFQPNNREFHNNLANALREEGRLDEALVHYEKAAQIDPNSYEAQFNLAKALGLKGRLEESIARYEAALRLEPGFLPAHLSLGNALLQQGRPRSAAPHFQRVLELRPTDARAHLNLGLCWFQLGQWAEAKAEYEVALRITPTDPGLENNLAWLLATCPKKALRDGNRALDLANQANTQTGGDKPIIVRTVAAALAEAGLFPEAVEAAQRAARLAGEQSLPDLARQVQSELALYRARKPIPSEPAP